MSKRTWRAPLAPVGCIKGGDCLGMASSVISLCLRRGDLMSCTASFKGEFEAAGGWGWGGGAEEGGWSP